MSKILCLTMIVKNESKIITRCLDSIIKYIDYWVICDTGSTDNTQTIIQNYFKKYNIPGELHQTSWTNFGHNRTEAVQLSKNKADYLLLMDADFIFKCYDPNFKNQLDKDAYLVNYEGQMDWWQLLLVKSCYDWKYKGRTHEHITLADIKITTGRISEFKILHSGDGAMKTDKFQRDKELLLEDLKENPSNSRACFYLAQTYFALQDWENAKKYYLQRSDMPNYDEEIYYSLYMHGMCTINTKQSLEESLEYLIKAYQFRPQRLEALYEAIKLCRLREKYYLGYTLGITSSNTPYPSEDKLFVNRPVHEYEFFRELLYCAHQINNMKECYQLSEKILKHSDKFPKSYLQNLQNIHQMSKRKIDIETLLKNISIDSYQESIIKNNKNKVIHIIPNEPRILIIGNFASFNMNKNLSNNPPKPVPKAPQSTRAKQAPTTKALLIIILLPCGHDLMCSARTDL